jgi:imidazole glycerol-phosphate synthase subunit HisH
MITIVNYGLGNLNAFRNVYSRLNIPVTIASRKEDLQGTDKIILPGVGAFDHAMTMLQNSGMRETLDELVLQKQIPVLGICVGMQMLANSSEEGILPGLSWINGVVKKIDATKILQKTRLPHMGWNTINAEMNNKILGNLNAFSRFYFLHSYYFRCTDPRNVIATTEYGISFASAVNSGNIFGVQFHPEKSHNNGIQVLKNFANL